MALLALLVSSSTHANAERPQLKDFNSYTEFLRAVVDYTRLDTPANGAERQCRDDEVDDEGKPINKDNPCKPRLVREDAIRGGKGDGAGRTSASGNIQAEDDRVEGVGTLDDQGSAIASLPGTQASTRQGSGDALEDAIALARDGLNPVYVDPGNTRTTFRSFPMQPVDSNDLAAVSLIDALAGLLVTNNNTRLRLNIDPSSFTNPLAAEDDRVNSSLYSLQLDDLALQQLLLANIAGFDTRNIVWTTGGSYYSVVNADPYLIGSNGIGLNFSTDARLRMAIVDSDGFAPALGAGAVVIDPLHVTTSNIAANLFSVDDGRGSKGVLASLDITNGINVNLSNMQVGVAGATRNAEGGWNIGRVSNFLFFGDDSTLSISMDSPLEIMFKNTDNAATDPLIQVNGAISTLDLKGMSLMDINSGGGIHFDSIGITNLSMVNTSVYFNNNTIRVDMGNSLTNLRMVIANIVLGGPLERASRPAGIGDAEIRFTRVDSMEMTIQPH